MLEILLNIGEWYLKIGAGVYLLATVYLIIKNDIMPWNFIGIVLGMLLQPGKLLRFLFLSIGLVLSWPTGFSMLKRFSRSKGQKE
jgi:hypothetical protein